MADFLFDENDIDWKKAIPELQAISGLDLKWLYRKEYRCVQTVDKLYELADYLKGKKFIAVDTETTGLLFLDKTVSVQICAESNISYFIPIRMKSCENISPTVFVDALKEILESQDYTIIAFNS